MVNNLERPKGPLAFQSIEVDTWCQTWCQIQNSNQKPLLLVSYNLKALLIIVLESLSEFYSNPYPSPYLNPYLNSNLNPYTQAGKYKQATCLQLV